MRATKTLLLTTAATIVAANSAMAADIFVPPPEEVPVVVEHPGKNVDWNGFYAGLHGGGGWGPSDSTFQSGAPSPADFDLSGPYVGGQVGYNFLFGGGWLVGIEADANWSGIDGQRDSVVDTTQDIDWFGTVRGRVGYVWDHWMPYVTGGWAWANATRFNSSFGGQTATASYHGGWTIGAGVEWGIANNWTLKGEYKYIDFGSGDYNWPILPVSVDLKIHTFEIGLNYQF